MLQKCVSPLNAAEDDGGYMIIQDRDYDPDCFDEDVVPSLLAHHPNIGENKDGVIEVALAPLVAPAVRAPAALITKMNNEMINDNLVNNELDEGTTDDATCVFDLGSNDGDCLEVDEHGRNFMKNSDLSELIACTLDKPFFNKLSVLSWVLNNNVSESAFRGLTNLYNWDSSKQIEGYEEEDCKIPLNLQYLKEKVFEKVGPYLPVKQLEVGYKAKNGVTTKTANAAYVSLIDQIQLSLHDEVFYQRAVANTASLPSRWWLPDSLRGIIDVQKGSPDKALLWRVSDGTHWLKNIQNHHCCLKQLNPAKINIVLQYSFYVDDVKIGAINSSVSETCFMVSIRDHYDGGASFGNTAIYVMMLANAVGTCKSGYDEYWRVFTEEVVALASGVEMNINGVSVVVYAFDHCDLGDTPAQRTGKSFSKTTNLEKPCRCCGCILERMEVHKVGKEKESVVHFIRSGQQVYHSITILYIHGFI
jgi:hypothetical protein